MSLYKIILILAYKIHTKCTNMSILESNKPVLMVAGKQDYANTKQLCHILVEK